MARPCVDVQGQPDRPVRSARWLDLRLLPPAWRVFRLRCQVLTLNNRARSAARPGIAGLGISDALLCFGAGLDRRFDSRSNLFILPRKSAARTRPLCAERSRRKGPAERCRCPGAAVPVWRERPQAHTLRRRDRRALALMPCVAMEPCQSLKSAAIGLGFGGDLPAIFGWLASGGSGAK